MASTAPDAAAAPEVPEAEILLTASDGVDVSVSTFFLISLAAVTQLTVSRS